MIYVGIDPGKTGGVGFIDDKGKGWGELVDTGDVLALWNIIEPITRAYHIAHVGVEKVHSMPGQGVKSVFSFGRAAMGAEAVPTLLHLPWSYVRPQEWNKVVFADREKPKEKAARKRAVLDAARARWPMASLRRQKDSGLADALWMALVIQRRESGA